MLVHVLIGTSDAMLWTRWWTFVFHIRGSTSWVSKILLDF